MPARVAVKGQISINGVYYWLNKDDRGQYKPVTQRLASRFAPKFVTGDTNKDSHERASVWAPRFHGGIGKYRIKPGEESTRAWWATMPLR